MSSSEKIIFPSVFTYIRSIEPGICTFFAVDSDGNKEPIVKQVNKLRATFSGHKQANDGKKDSKGLAQGNIHIVESAFMPSGYDRLQLEFSFKVINNSLTASESNNVDVKKVFEKFALAYKRAGGIEYISKKYIESLLSGHFLWRNKKMLEDIQLEITVKDKHFSLAMPTDAELKDKSPELVSIIDELSARFAIGLTDENNVATFTVKAYGKASDGQQVFPSQEFCENKNDKNPSRVLATRKMGNKEAVVFTSAKLGNALRRVDTWYEDDALYALPVEPLGIDREMSIARRHADKSDFFTICSNNLHSIISELEEGNLSPDAHYVFACLIRGGVYNGESKKK